MTGPSESGVQSIGISAAVLRRSSEQGVLPAEPVRPAVMASSSVDESKAPAAAPSKASERAQIWASESAGRAGVQPENPMATQNSASQSSVHGETDHAASPAELLSMTQSARAELDHSTATPIGQPVGHVQIRLGRLSEGEASSLESAQQQAQQPAQASQQQVDDLSARPDRGRLAEGGASRLESARQPAPASQQPAVASQQQADDLTVDRNGVLHVSASLSDPHARLGHEPISMPRIRVGRLPSTLGSDSDSHGRQGGHEPSSPLAAEQPRVQGIGPQSHDASATQQPSSMSSEAPQGEPSSEHKAQHAAGEDLTSPSLAA